MAKKDNRPKANPSNCIQSLEAYFETQSQMIIMMPEAIEALRRGDKASQYMADVMERHYNKLQEFHQKYLD